ncbi:unnamed protein product [Cylicocyclus nassatus]|uniref:ShKT domain-containing protein n=1 Tax=Cylicocyclus nassatus TaxID=53992 RepID=A0AA36GRQ4_CYLNA|nr:unnamed protein product [Cylicocyclus nassatus]
MTWQYLPRILVFVALLASPAYCQNCNNAPTEALQIICSQIAAWNANARNQPTISTASVSAPGSAAGAISTLAVSENPRTAYECMDIACLCTFFGGTGGNNCVLPGGARLGRALRKEYRVMTDAERNRVYFCPLRYHTAMWTIKGNGDYDTLSRIHSSFVTSPGAHSGPAFLPWHREFIKRIEIALRRVDPSVALPYWDSTMDSTIPNPTESSMFTNELQGRTSPDGLIATGAFRGWRTVDNSRVFRRSIGSQGRLFVESDITAVLNTNDYTQVLAYTAPSNGCPNPANWAAFEYSHGNPHIWIGGDMFTPTTSTNDPIFWNHHSFVDLIWENWRQARQSRAVRESQYPPNNPQCSSEAHYGNNIMQPFFPMTNRDGLLNSYTDNLYTFQARPTCSAGNPAGCGSRFLFCDLSHGAPRCAAKIAVNGNCGGYTRNEDRCYLSTCQNNRCISNQNPPATTQPPIVTTTPAGQNQETCFNEQQCCSIWAARGECQRNPNYMNSWCRASCGICRPTTYNLNTECSNRHPTCQAWAARGECQNNPAWMTENCRQACNLCGTTRAQACGQGGGNPATTQRPPPAGQFTCLNQHYCCIAWAARGYCTSQTAYMNQYCQPSCNFCRGSQPPPLWNSQTCVDFSSNCQAWASQGQCNSNPQYMWENCKQTCGRCALTNLNTRLATCGFTRRLSRNGRPISTFRVNPFHLPLRRQSFLVSLAPAPATGASLAPPPLNRKALPKARLSRRPAQRERLLRPSGMAVF